ncbi:MAG: FAD-dependent oxidoreductase, partial [Polyangiaceae bacterium]
MTEGLFDTAVVGGGLGGLAAATLLARRGHRVVLLERARELGGRAASDLHEGWCFNRGAHALYRGAAAERVLASLGVRWEGRAPSTTGIAELDGRPYAMPSTPGALLSTGLVGLAAKWSGARLLARIRSIDPRALAGVSMHAWL